MKYPITITTTKIVNIESNSIINAELQCKDLYEKGNIVMDNAIENVTFKYKSCDHIDFLINLITNDIQKIESVTLDEIKSRSNSPRIATARRILIIILSNKYKLQNVDIARRLRKTTGMVTMTLKVWGNNLYKHKYESNLYAEVLNKYK